MLFIQILIVYKGTLVYIAPDLKIMLITCNKQHRSYQVVLYSFNSSNIMVSEVKGKKSHTRQAKL